MSERNEDCVYVIFASTLTLERFLSLSLSFFLTLHTTTINRYDAASRAQIDKAVRNMPQGYDTVVGERGLKLSGGEKQRVAIARALMKRKATLLLCDEATSALDTATESSIMDIIKDEKKTTMLIAHRLSTVKDADKILVLEKGSVVEDGTHDELIEKGGLYFEMWNDQSKKRNVM